MHTLKEVQKPYTHGVGLLVSWGMFGNQVFENFCLVFLEDVKRHEATPIPWEKVAAKILGWKEIRIILKHERENDPLYVFCLVQMKFQRRSCRNQKEDGNHVISDYWPTHYVLVTFALLRRRHICHFSSLQDEESPCWERDLTKENELLTFCISFIGRLIEIKIRGRKIKKKNTIVKSVNYIYKTTRAW